MDRDDLMIDFKLPEGAMELFAERVKSPGQPDRLMIRFPVLPSLLGAVFAQSGKMMETASAKTWVFNDVSVSWNVLPGQFDTKIVKLSRTMFRESIYKRYAQTINHARPRKISWRRLNRQQKDRAIELAKAGLL